MGEILTPEEYEIALEDAAASKEIEALVAALAEALRAEDACRYWRNAPRSLGPQMDDAIVRKTAARARIAAWLEEPDERR